MKSGPLLTAVLVLAVACGDVGPLATTTTEPATTTSSPAAATTTVAAVVTSTTIEVVTSTTENPVDVVIDGGVASGPTVFSYEVGDTVDITVVSDVDDELHVHGYELVFEMAADVPITLDFVVDVPGVFEVEIHTGHAHVFDLEVSG
jgi:hypothetical protein